MNFLEIAVFLVEHGAEIEKPNSIGETPCSFAAKTGALDVLELLIQKGAHVDRQDNQGNTPLHYAAEVGQLSSGVLLKKCTQFCC